MIRSEATPNDTEVCSELIKNGKFFVNPAIEGKDFKALLKDAFTAGAGRPVDANGFPEGPWTPDLLASAISEIDANSSGVELRSVQRWFQDNESGVNPENIRWLARIFGCDDPDATSDWQRLLSTSHSRFIAERRKKKNAGQETEVDSLQVPTRNQLVVKDDKSGLSVWCEGLFDPSDSAANLIAAFWFVYVALIFFNYGMGTLSVTYEPMEGMHKQVGFIWAPSLTLLPIVVLPTFILAVSRLLSSWKKRSLEIQVALSEEVQAEQIGRMWTEKLLSNSVMFYSALALCVLFVFGFQWAGIYLPIYYSGEAGQVQIDRYLVSLFRPDVISTPKAVVLSMVGYMYTSSYIFIFLLGLILNYLVVTDLAGLAAKVELHGGMGKQHANVQHGLRRAKRDVAKAAFGVAISGMWLATCIKLQIVYLSSDAKNFWSWFANDALSALGMSEPSGWLGQSAVSFTTTSLMALLSFVVLTYTWAKTSTSVEKGQTISKRAKYWRIGVFVSAILVTVDAIFAGTFVGFSYLTTLSFVALINCLWLQFSTGGKPNYD